MTRKQARILHTLSAVLCVVGGLTCLALTVIHGVQYLPGLIPMAVCALGAIGIDVTTRRLSR